MEMVPRGPSPEPTLYLLAGWFHGCYYVLTLYGVRMVNMGELNMADRHRRHS